MRRWTTPLAVVTIMAALAFAAAAAASERAFDDARSDGGDGADITRITVRNEADGSLAFGVSLAAPLSGDHGLAFAFDVDKSTSTGGHEYLVVIGPRILPVFARWDGARFVVQGIPVGFAASGLATTEVGLRFNASVLGTPTGFSFDLMSFRISQDGTSLEPKDRAPDAGGYTVDLTLPQCGNAGDDDGDGKVDAADPGCSSADDADESDDPITLRLGKAATTPARPRAGAPVTVSAAATRVETAARLDEGRVVCDRTIRGRRTRSSGRLVAGRAVCTFTIPRNAAGAVVRGQISVLYRNATASTSFGFRAAS